MQCSLVQIDQCEDVLKVWRQRQCSLFYKNLLLEQNVFNITTLSFDDNKVLKMSTGMLIFVQVCRTIDKNLSVFKSSIGSGRTNESNGIYKKEACVAR